MEALERIVLAISNNPWPFIALTGLLILGLLLICLLFRKPIGSKIQDMKRLRMSGKQLGIDFDNLQKEKNKSATPETDLKKETQAKKPDMPQEENPVVVFWYHSWQFEKISHDIYPGQVDMLTYLSSCKNGTDYLTPLFERFYADDFVRAYFKHPYNFFQYLGFLSARRFIEVAVSPNISETTACITQLGRDFLVYIAEQGYGKMYHRPALFAQPTVLAVSGQWQGEVTGDNSGTVNVDFRQHGKECLGQIVFSDLVFGKVRYELRGTLSEDKIRAFLLAPQPLEVRENLTFSPAGLIFGQATEDLSLLVGAWTMSLGRCGHFRIERAKYLTKGE